MAAEIYCLWLINAGPVTMGFLVPKPEAQGFQRPRAFQLRVKLGFVPVGPYNPAELFESYLGAVEFGV